MNTESSITEHFLVYGTLRPGSGNYDNYFPYVIHSVKTVRIPGFMMFSSKYFPYAVYGTDSDSIECSLITVTDTPSNVQYLMEGLDDLEGYKPGSNDNHYDRITIPVDDIEAHLYVVSNRFLDHHVTSLPIIDTGNWHDVDAPNDVAYMWVYPGEDLSIIPDSSVEPRIVEELPSDEEEDIYPAEAYAEIAV